MPPKFLYIPIEVQNREYFAKALLAAFAAVKGYQVLLGRDSQIFNLLKMKFYSGQEAPPGVMLYNALADVEYNDLCIYRNAGVAIVSLDEEALSWGYRYKTKSEFAPRISDRNIDLACRILVWGQFQQDILRRLFPQACRKSVVTGNPRFDILRYPFRQVHEEYVQEIHKQHTPYLLINSNIVWINKKAVDSLANLKRAYLGAEFDHKKHVDGIVDYARVNFQACVQLAGVLRQRFPDKKVIIRPHPLEDASYWKESCRRLDGVEIILQGSAIPWVLASDSMIHMGCTTGYEASFLKHPQVLFLPGGKTANWLYTEPECSHEEQVVELLGSQMKSGYEAGPSDGMARELHRLFANYQGPLACVRILNVIDGIDWRREVLESEPPAIEQNVEPFSVNFSVPHMQRKFIGISRNSLAGLLATYAESMPEFKDLRLHQIDDDLFLITR